MFRNLLVVTRLLLLLPTLMLSPDLQAQCEPGASIMVVESDESEGIGQTPVCDGPYRGKSVTGEKLAEAVAEGETNFCGANLSYADLSEVSLWNVDLSGADLTCAKLTNAFLSESNLSGAILMDTDLSGADLAFANLSKAQFEPLPGKLPPLDAIALAYGLSELTYYRPPALVNLRTQFRNAGYRDQERQITHALRHGETVSKFERGFDQPWLDYALQVLDGSFNYLLFGLTTKWGMKPGRALWAVLVLIVLFTPTYWWALRRPGGDGIWKVWSERGLRDDLIKNETDQPLELHGFKAWKTALYFSVISSFNIGWRELNVGNWISRLQRYEFTYRATGLVRTVSGAQSLLSVYLVAMWALTYFGRPFE